MNLSTDTFNTFWDNVGRNIDFSSEFKSNSITKNEKNLNKNNSISNICSENINNSLDSSFEENDVDSAKVLKVLEDKTQKEIEREVEHKNAKIEEYEEEELTQQPESEHDPFKCYFCIVFPSTNNKKKYEERVSLNHPRLLAYPLNADLKRISLRPQGEKWEI